MKCYRSLNAYGLAMEGHVRKVLISDMASSMECCFLKADVTPSQRTTAKPYEPWVLVKRDGTVSTAHCTCMAGVGRCNRSHPEYCQLFGNIEAPFCHHFITIFQLLSEVCQED
ncbi:hypothetical protein HPB52_008938 [Rhipicephalus sanguineus]|uniref:SWIM-type domain-containing protein n=1 Tax=Rhipicephalus sanguineus TaxID=34632 RepID=A0A9D4PF19_RHISA|nr:hypothetical protein HPB52_008938 [Rhipicephalus sanguineus]